jgi:glutathione synthase/RimK-type ligase-like ATP-grasp enzyme
MLGAESILSRRDPVGKQFHKVVNWGNPTTLTVSPNVKVYNAPSYIAHASNKLTAFQIMSQGGVRVPEFVTETPDKGMWLARTILAGSCGDGIVVVREKDENKQKAPLYTKYIKKSDELRIHVAFGKAIFVQFKKKQGAAEQTPDQKLIRNHDNGWVFCPRPVADAPKDSVEQALLAVSSLKLDFGAVDIVISKDDGMPYVLEVNTAPGIESPTLAEAYQTAFTQELVHNVRALGG